MAAVWVAVVVSFVSCVVAQAPGDGDQLCVNETINGMMSPFFSNPSYAVNNERVLMDSRNYVRLLQGDTHTWQSVDNDDNNANDIFTEWSQQILAVCNGAVTVCGFSAGAQQNWLITQHISRVLPGGQRLRKVTALFNVTLNGCDISRQCRQSFDLFKWQTSTINRTAARNTDNYVRVERVTPVITSGLPNAVEYQDIELDAEDGFYLAVVDLSTCISIHRILVLYYICPEETSQLISRPETIGGTDVVEGECVENSSTLSGSSPLLGCGDRGQWGVLIQCLCNAGYELDESQNQCSECPVGTYSEGVSNGPCEACPANSEATQTGLAECPCIEDYYRAPKEGISVACTQSPSSPQNVTISDLTNTSAVLTWLPPESSGGRNFSEIYYTITIKATSGGGVTVVVPEVTDTETNVTGLTPGTYYTFSVTAENAVSSQDTNIDARTTTITATTLEIVPKDRRVCMQGDVQLVNGNNISTALGRGRVEVCSASGIWCNEGWDDMDAEVVCRLLGFNGTGHEAVTNISMFGQGSTDSDILLAQVSCCGDEDNLTSCPHSTGAAFTEACSHDEDAGIICSLNNTLQNGPPNTLQPPTGSFSSSTAIIVGSTVGVIIPILIVVVVIVAVVVVHRKRDARKKVLWNNLEKDRETSSVLVLREQQTTMGITMPPTSKPTTDSVASKTDPWNMDDRLKKIMVSKEQLHLSNTIGEGEFGLVYRGYIDTAAGTKLVAVKTSKALCSENDKKNLMKEMSTMASFQHANVMSLLGVCLDGEMPLLIMPFMSKGCVLDHVRHNKEDFLLESQARKTRTHFLGMCLQITKGMKYLATHKFVHRDLAARNCMIDENDVVKVADFGLSEDIYCSNYFRRNKDETASDEKVPIRWMAPECIETDKYTERSDVWAFGVTCWEIFTCGSTPYSGVRAMSILPVLKTGQRLVKPSNHACTDEIYDNMTVCWADVPAERPSFTNLVTAFNDLLETESGYLDLLQS